jgi:monothiol glutaredoxin
MATFPGGPVKQISATELKAMLASGEPLELVDVRTEDERAIACIDGSRLLDREYGDYILALDRDTTLVFQCHHGIRSQAAAEYCVEKGFRNVYNVVGGIDAWSLTVDRSVPRY